MTGELKKMGWMFNHKKVYRLMKEANPANRNAQMDRIKA
jgi:hypothetical protein